MRASSNLLTGQRYTAASAGDDHSLALVSWPNAPIVTNQLTTGISTTSANLTATVNPNGGSHAVAFEVGLTPSYGTTIAATPGTVDGTTPVLISAEVSGLLPGVTYHYRVTIDGTIGEDHTFTTTQSSNPDLASLHISEGVLSPAFASGTTSYTVSVTSQTSSIVVTPRVADYGTVTVNEEAVASGALSSPIPLGVGTNVLTIVGTSQDGSTTKTYTVTVTRPPETNTLDAIWNEPHNVPATTSGYMATGSAVNLTLNCIPLANELTVIRNTGRNFIQGEFDNLAHGQAVALIFDGQTYNFVANYYGGSGNDLVLVWAGTRVQAWGNNGSSRLGDGTTTERRIPVDTVGSGVFTGKTVIAVASGAYHSLALCSDSTIAAWGYNNKGQLGDGSQSTRTEPVAVDQTGVLTGKSVVSVAAGESHSLALCSDGSLAAWGSNDSGQLGDNSMTNRTLPVLVDASAGSALHGKSVVAISAGSGHNLALCTDGSVAAWGGSYGATPSLVDDLEGSALHGKRVIAVGAGHGFSLALADDGIVVGWGANNAGQLGDNTRDYRSIPVRVNTEAGVSALAGKFVTGIAAGFNFGLACCSDGTVTGWGRNVYGQLGNSSWSNASFESIVPTEADASPGSALAGKKVISLAALWSTSFALCSDGSIAAWGYAGHLGTNNYSATGNAVRVPVAVNRSSHSVSDRFTGLFVGCGYDQSWHALALVSSSVAPPPPTCTTSPVTDLTLTSVTLNGTVNANGYNTSVAFEYGTDGISYPHSIDVTPVGLNGTEVVPVTAAVTGLTKGTTYYYRLAGQNQGGTGYSAAQSFITRTEPVALVGSATLTTTTSAVISGSVNAHGSDSQVFFDYGTSPGLYTNSVVATPTTVAGYGDTPVSATLTNLTQFTTYYFRVRAISVAGEGTSNDASFQMASLSGLTTTFPNAPPDAQGFVFVNLAPSGLLHGWRFVGEQQWRASGVPVGGLSTGSRDIEFRPVPGSIHPPTESVAVTSGAAATVISRSYYVSAVSGSGAISVTMKPDSVATGPDRAQWRLLGEGEAHWRDSGSTLAGLSAGSYLIESKPVAGFATPPNTNVTVLDGQTALLTITHFLPDATTGTPPTVLAYESVTGDTTKPYAYVGQIRSNVGSSTGFVVKPRVVATAAHVVWDDGTLSAVEGLQWLFQRHRGLNEPKPLIPRGHYTFDGYAAQRIADNSPGDSSPEARNLDVAAIYFNEDAGRGGYGGFLASDLAQNEFLLSSADKMLIGYPVDGIPAGSQGRMHATTPADILFTPSFGRTFVTSAIRSSGGNSGGPLCVEHSNGCFYPAAIYLGGNAQTIVRAIDSEVIELFDRAEVSSTGGSNNTGGGISHTSVSAIASPSAGAIKVLIEPEAARNAGAAWRLAGDSSYQPHLNTVGNLNPGTFVLQMTPVAGFEVPADSPVTVSGGSLTEVTYTYTTELTPQESWRQEHFGTTANSGDAADDNDFDHDGFTNAEEYAAGTNPTQAGDSFKVAGTSHVGASFTATTSGKAGRTYVLQRSTTLAPSSWGTVDTIGPLSSDGSVSLTDAARPTDAAFYRIQVTGP